MIELAIIHGNADLASESGDAVHCVIAAADAFDYVMDSAPELLLAQQAYNAVLRSIPRPAAPVPWP